MLPALFSFFFRPIFDPVFWGAFFSSSPPTKKKEIRSFFYCQKKLFRVFHISSMTHTHVPLALGGLCNDERVLFGFPGKAGLEGV
ncbi:hypothetical protein [Varunaivibrio sulfuroxidans]|uniref:hypothetical protein n=1 Tax=Varunaivibrio sulfuroxidans TaxID=1773489 RepID=UPI0010503A7A|nr:hypothetical protein [Varunaivibrio sulfuroxidans]WES31231.1 hypothetical protein P3M64_02325 [Varunaivibrio sulfuroxidans]